MDASSKPVLASHVIWLPDLGFVETPERETQGLKVYEDHNGRSLFHRPGTDEYYIENANGCSIFDGKIPNVDFAKSLIDNLNI